MNEPANIMFCVDCHKSLAEEREVCPKDGLYCAPLDELPKELLDDGLLCTDCYYEQLSEADYREWLAMADGDF